MTIRSTFIAIAFIWSTHAHAMTDLQDFDATSFQSYTTIRSEDYKVQKIPTKAGNISILRSAEFNKDLSKIEPEKLSQRHIKPLFGLTFL